MTERIMETMRQRQISENSLISTRTSVRKPPNAATVPS
jgi:hypothetical protein